MVEATEKKTIYQTEVVVKFGFHDASDEQLTDAITNINATVAKHVSIYQRFADYGRHRFEIEAKGKIVYEGDPQELAHTLKKALQHKLWDYLGVESYIKVSVYLTPLVESVWSGHNDSDYRDYRDYEARFPGRKY